MTPLNKTSHLRFSQAVARRPVFFYIDKAASWNSIKPELNQRKIMKKPHVANVVIVTANLGSEILLVHKPPENEKDKLRTRKRIGMNRWVQPGGGVEESDLSLLHAAQRETLQETGLEFPIDAFQKVGILEGFNQGNEVEPLWLVHIYRVAAWPDMYGQIRLSADEHDDIRWFPLNQIPWNEMIESDQQWLPQLLVGKSLSIRVMFEGETEKVCWCRVDEAKFN